MDQDFEYIADLVEEFFSQSRTQQSLSIIHDQKITGWEVWLQIVLRIYLKICSGLRDWIRPLSIFDLIGRWAFINDSLFTKMPGADEHQPEMDDAVAKLERCSTLTKSHRYTQLHHRYGEKVQNISLSLFSRPS